MIEKGKKSTVKYIIQKSTSTFSANEENQAGFFKVSNNVENSEFSFPVLNNSKVETTAGKRET